MLTSFESDLMRLRHIENKLTLLWEEFSKLPNIRRQYTFKSLVQEHIIIIIDNFIEARQTILKDFKDNGYDKLDLALRPLCEPILEYEKIIHKVRSNYFAHIQSPNKIKQPFEISIDEILATSGFPSSTGDMLVLVGTARLYIEFVRRSCEKEWNSGVKKYENQRTQLTPIGIHSERNASKIIKERGNQAVSNLKKFGIIELPQIP